MSALLFLWGQSLVPRVAGSTSTPDSLPSWDFYSVFYTYMGSGLGVFPNTMLDSSDIELFLADLEVQVCSDTMKRGCTWPELYILYR